MCLFIKVYFEKSFVINSKRGSELSEKRIGVGII